MKERQKRKPAQSVQEPVPEQIAREQTRDHIGKLVGVTGRTIQAAEVYGKRQQLAEESIAHATAIMVDALALMGEMLRAAEKAPAGRPPKIGSRPEPISDMPPTLAEVGISKKESSVAQALPSGCYV